MSFHNIDGGKGILPDLEVSIDVTNDPTNTTRVWTDVTTTVRQVSLTRSGRNDPTQNTQPGQITLVLDNRTGDFDPSNTSGPYYPNVKQARWLQVRGQWDGVAYNRFTGIITGIEQNWPSAGKDATVTVTGVGVLGILNVFDLGGNDFPSERSDQRVSAVCALLPLETSLDTGASTMVDSGTISVSTSALSHLQQVELSENGRLFDDAGGTVVFQSRHWRFLNAADPAGTIGDTAGEIPYTDSASLRKDDTNLWNVAVVTPSGGTAETGSSPSSGTAFFPRTMTRQILVASQAEALSCAQYLASLYGDPAPKLPVLKLQPARDTSLWPAVLSLSNSQRVRFNRGAVNPISQDGYVEQIGETITPNVTWEVSVQISAALDQQGWVLGDAVFGLLGESTVLIY